MSKPNGISRRSRRLNRNEKKEKVVQKSNQSESKRQVSDLFSDFDLSDINIGFNSINNSFKSSKNGFNSTSNEDSIVGTNASIVSKPFVGFGKSLIGSEISANSDENDSKTTNDWNSFKSRYKSSNNTTNFDINESICRSNSNKRKNISVVFQDIDLSDVPIDESVVSFQSARKSIKNEDNTEESVNKENLDAIDWNEYKTSLDESFRETEEFIEKLPKIESNLDKNDISFDSVDDQYFLKGLDYLEQTLTSKSNKPLVKDSELLEHKSDSNAEPIEDNKYDVNYILRTDFSTYNEKTSQEFFNEYNAINSDKKVENIETERYMHFRTGNGRRFHLSEVELSKSKLLFQDIEEWLLSEINANKSFVKSEDKAYTYSQKFVSNSSISGQQKWFQLNSTKTSETDLVSTKRDHKWSATSDSMTDSAIDLNSDNSDDLMSTSYRFNPLKACPQNTPFSDKQSLIPLTSTPKSSLIKRKINFD